MHSEKIDKRIEVRSLKLADSKMVYRWLSDKAISRTASLPYPYTEDMAIGYIKQSHKALQKHH